MNVHSHLVIEERKVNPHLTRCDHSRLAQPAAEHFRLGEELHDFPIERLAIPGPLEGNGISRPDRASIAADAAIRVRKIARVTAPKRFDMLPVLSNLKLPLPPVLLAYA